MMKAAIIKPHRKSEIFEDFYLEETKNLVKSAGLQCVYEKIILLDRINPDTVIGSGNIDLISNEIAKLEIDILLIDCSLKPSQQRNLEKKWKIKIIDRVALIIDIFAQRAKTMEGKLQVEIAKLNYEKSRLAGLWTHLERQRGSSGFIGGPGEKQIEIDKRLIEDKIQALQNELESVVRTRCLNKRKRKNSYDNVAIVGYTNVGKSMLFSKLTKKDILVQDQLFATLDPNVSQLILPSCKEIIISDTVGFVSDLPHMLVAAFKATLEEAVYADLILHVQDISNPHMEKLSQHVLQILKEIGLKESTPILNVYNKIDLLDNNIHYDMMSVYISAKKDIGLDNLLHRLEFKLAEGKKVYKILIPYESYNLIKKFYKNYSVIETKETENGTEISFMANQDEYNYINSVIKKK